jgi:uncharacterized membrane protein YraQ (UPF0718 family)
MSRKKSQLTKIGRNRLDFKRAVANPIPPQVNRLQPSEASSLALPGFPAESKPLSLPGKTFQTTDGGIVRPISHLLKPFGQNLPFVTLAVSGIAIWLMGETYFANFWNIYLGLMLEVLPFFILGAILAALIATLKLPDLKIWRRVTRNRAGAMFTGLALGFVLPVCECGTASVARQTNRAGAPLLMSIVFLLAAPVINPVTLLVTYLAFNGNWLIIIGRIALALLVALLVGIILSLYPKPADLFLPGSHQPEKTGSGSGHSDQAGEANCHHHSHEEQPPRTGKAPQFNNFLELVIKESLEAIRIGLPGIGLAAVFQASVPSHYFTDLGQGALLSVIALMLLASLMSICSSADAFVALSFSGLMPAGSILAFLVFGPLINLKSLFLFRLVLTWRTIALMAVFSFSLIVPVGLFINYWVA